MRYTGRISDPFDLVTKQYVDNRSGVTSVNGATGAVTIDELPEVTSADNNKVLKVIDGEWKAGTNTGGGASLPVTTNLLKGDGEGGAVAATPGEDYLTEAQVIVKENESTFAEAWAAIAENKSIIAYDSNEEFIFQLISSGENDFVAFYTILDGEVCFIRVNSDDTWSRGTLALNLSSMTSDSTHRTVTDAQISTWNGKANDSDVVHKTGAETVGGIKTFNDNTFFNGTATWANCDPNFTSDYMYGMYQWDNMFQFTKRTTGNTYINEAWHIQLDTEQLAFNYPTSFASRPTVNSVQVALKSDTGELSQLNTTAKNNLVASINELFTDVSNGKTAVASAITDMGVTTASDATFSTMATNIRAIPFQVYRTGHGAPPSTLGEDGDLYFDLG